MKIDLPNFNLKPGDFCNFCSSYSNPESSISTQTLHLSYPRSTSLLPMVSHGSRESCYEENAKTQHKLTLIAIQNISYLNKSFWQK